MENLNSRNFFEQLEKFGTKLNQSQKERILANIQEIKTYIPKVGLFGKTGAGKSSLANALFGEKLCEISDIEACTRNPQEVILGLGENGRITLLDVPGIGESRERDEEYGALYQSILPELDLVLWLLKADERAYATDQEFYQNFVKPHMEKGKPVLFVLNQADKIAPEKEWDNDNHLPSINQQRNIENKVSSVAGVFNISTSKIIPVSASERYNLVDLVDKIVFALPDKQKVTIVKYIDKTLISERAAADVNKSAVKAVFGGVMTGAVIGFEIGGPVGAGIGGIIGGIVGWFSR